MKKYHCYLCKKYKSENEFVIDKNRGNGVSSRCNSCKKKYDKRRTKNRGDYFKEYRKNNKEKLSAKYQVAYAIKKGLLKKEPCEICGKIKVVAHHPDYSKPLKVIWLCHKHHMAIHFNK